MLLGLNQTLDTVYKDVIDLSNNTYYEGTLKRCSLVIRIDEAILQVDFNNVYTTSLLDITPLDLFRPNVSLHLQNPHIFKSELNEISTMFSDYIPIFTDGSKNVGCTIDGNLHNSKLWVPDHASVMSGEVEANDLALTFADESRGRNL